MRISHYLEIDKNLKISDNLPEYLKKYGNKAKFIRSKLFKL